MVQTPVPYNLLTDKADAFDAYVQFVIGTNDYRPKSLASVNVIFGWADQEKYDDTGNLYLSRTGQGHSATVDLTLTRDLVNTTVYPGTPTLSFNMISDIIAAKEGYTNGSGTYIPPQRVQLSVVQVFLTQATASDKWIRLQFTLDVQGVSLSRGTGGVVSARINGRILNMTGLNAAGSATTINLDRESSAPL